MPFQIGQFFDKTCNRIEKEHRKMTMSMNKVVVIGHLGKDPEIIKKDGGLKIANFTMATSDKWTDKTTGEVKEKTEWHRVCIFNDRLVDVVEKYVKKGSYVYVEGKLQTRKWTDQQGIEKYTTEIVLSQFKGEIGLLDSKSEASSASYELDDDISW